jgi:hypothetical protein
MWLNWNVCKHNPSSPKTIVFRIKCPVNSCFAVVVCQFYSGKSDSFEYKKKVKLFLCLLMKHYAMKAYGGVNVKIHIFLTSALVGCEWSASRPSRFTPDTHWIGGWVNPRAGLNDVEKRKFLTLPGLELRPLDLEARSQSLYRPIPTTLSRLPDPFE